MSIYLPLFMLIVTFICVALLIQHYIRNAGNKLDESWRDKQPLMYRLVRPIVSVFTQSAIASLDAHKLAIVTDRLSSAGLFYTIQAEEFVVTKRVYIVIGLLIFLYIYFVMDLVNPTVIAVVSLVIPVAYYYPDIWLRDQIKRRQHAISKMFPFFLDLLVLSMRAGLNFASALDHSVQKMPTGPVKEEFTKVLRDTRTGLSRKEALSKMTERVQMPSVSNFVAAINQAEESGGEVGEVLSVQANQRRTERFLLAEKLANQAPVKMLVPLIGLLFPITFIIILFPILIKARDSGTLDFFFR